MPKPALSGFTTGASMIIISSNMKFFLGLDIPRGESHLGILALA